MTKTTSFVLVALTLVACGGSPSEPATTESAPITGGTGGSATTTVEVTGGSASVETTTAPSSPDAGLSPCEAKGGKTVTTSFISYGYYDTADGLISCQNFQFDAPQTLCTYSNSANQVSTTNLCATLSPASSCTYKTPITFGGMNTTGTEVDYYTVISHPNLSDWQESCRIIGGTWRTQ